MLDYQAIELDTSLLVYEFTLVSGGGQTVAPNAISAEPIIVKLLHQNAPAANVAVTLSTGGSASTTGTLGSSASGPWESAITLPTNSQGEVKVWWQAPSQENQTVSLSATAPGSTTPLSIPAGTGNGGGGDGGGSIPSNMEVHVITRGLTGHQSVHSGVTPPIYDHSINTETRWNDDGDDPNLYNPKGILTTELMAAFGFDELHFGFLQTFTNPLLEKERMANYVSRQGYATARSSHCFCIRNAGWSCLTIRSTGTQGPSFSLDLVFVVELTKTQDVFPYLKTHSSGVIKVSLSSINGPLAVGVPANIQFNGPLELQSMVRIDFETGSIHLEPHIIDNHFIEIRLLPVEIEVPDIQDTGPVLASNGTGSGTPTDPAAPAGGTSVSGAAPSGGSYETDPVKKATELKIAQMEGIYSGGQLTRDALDANHSLKIDNDRDRFRVRIPSIGNANAGPVFVKIATEGAADPDHNDNPTIVEMKSNGFDGDWVTDWQLLVSQHTPAPSAPGSGAAPQTTADDRYTNAEIATDDQDQAQGQIGDRTHVAELGSDVVIKAIKIGTSGSWTDMNLKIPVKVKREIPITFVKMNDAAADPARDLKLANERWAQVGIKFTSQGVTPMPVPAPLTNSDIMASDTTATGVTFGAQPKKLADTYKVMPGATPINGTRIVVFYCKDTRYPQANTPRGQDISGFATFSAWMNGTYQGGGSSPTAPGYENVIFLSENHWKPFTLAHELGHLLTNEGHFGQTNNPNPNLNADYPTPSPSAHQTEHNLMRLGGTSHIDSIGASKRLIDFQKKMVDEAENGIAK